MKERGNRLLRFLDRYAGIPIVFLLGILKQKKRKPDSIQSIALLKSAGIGDLVILSAVVKDLQGAYPAASVTLFTGKSNAEMGRMIPGVSVIPLPMTSPWKSLKIIRKHSFDVWIDADPWPRINALFTFCSRSKFTIGFKTAKQWRHNVYDKAINHSSACHEIENYRNLINHLGIRTYHRPNFSFSPKKPKEQKIALHLFPGGSRAALKQWEMGRWKELITLISQEGFKIICTGSKADRPHLEQLKQECFPSPIENVAGSLTLQETAEMLLTCACVISVDTGIMHLAAALGCPTICLHGPTSPKRWGAIGEKVIAVTPSFPYHPCIHLGFEAVCKENRCMKAITVSQVKQAVDNLVTIESPCSCP